MIKPIARWAFILFALFAVGPVLASWVHGVRATDGSHNVSLLLSEAPASSAMRGFVMLGVAAAFGIAGALTLGRDTGLAAMGIIVAWSSWTSGSTESLLRLAGSTEPLHKLALESAMVGTVGIAVAFIVQALTANQSGISGGLRGGGGLRLVESDEDAQGNPMIGAVAVIAAAAVVAGIAAWLIAVDANKGQAVVAAMVAGLAGGAAAQLAASAMGVRTGLPAVMIGLVAVGIVGPLVAGSASGARPVEAAFAGKLFGLGRVVALDWVAGGFIGIPIGLSWADSMLDRPASATASA